MSNEELMSQFQAGVVDAFDILVERFKDPLFSYLFRFVGDAAQCEDLLQETFLRVHRNRHAYRRIAKFSTWIFTIAGNLARSEYRRRRRRPTQSLNPTNRDDEQFELEIPDETYAPDRHASAVIEDELIQEALSSLQSEFREVIILRDIQELSYEEIAEITGLPMGTVKSRINRARSKMQRLLRDVYQPDDFAGTKHIPAAA